MIAEEGVGEFVERDCLLFVAGDYPDKGVRITEADLEEIAENSSGEIPVKIEHLAESPFDGALGVMTRVRAAGSQLWGTLRQPIEAWRLTKLAGAHSLSVGMDVGARRVTETSFVCRPRVAGAQVFGKIVRFETEDVMEEDKMTVRQFAEGLMAYLRGFTGGGEAEIGSAATADFAVERAKLEGERTDRQVLDWKREGKLRATERAESLARTLLSSGQESLVQFDGASVPLRMLFAQFVAENGPVVPMGELMVSDRSLGGRGAGERLVALAQEKSRREGLSYVQAFAAVSAADPEMARAARGEG